MKGMFDYTIAANAARRGYFTAYRDDETNRCPGCGRTHWYIGRVSAECGFCGVAIPLVRSCIPSGFGGHSRNRKEFEPSAFAA